MLCTVSGDPSGDDLSAFSNEVSKDPRVLIVNIQFLIGAEPADLSPHERSFLPIGARSFSVGFPHHLFLSFAPLEIVRRSVGAGYVLE